MLRFPRRSRAKFHAPMHPGYDFVFAEHLDGAIDDFAFGKQKAKPELAVFEHPFDFFRRILGSKAESIEGDSRVLLVKQVPGVKRRAQGRACVPGRRLNENVLEFLFERRN